MKKTARSQKRSKKFDLNGLIFGIPVVIIAALVLFIIVIPLSYKLYTSLQASACTSTSCVDPSCWNDSLNIRETVGGPADVWSTNWEHEHLVGRAIVLLSYYHGSCGEIRMDSFITVYPGGGGHWLSNSMSSKNWSGFTKNLWIPYNDGRTFGNNGCGSNNWNTNKCYSLSTWWVAYPNWISAYELCHVIYKTTFNWETAGWPTVYISQDNYWPNKPSSFTVAGYNPNSIFVQRGCPPYN